MGLLVPVYDLTRFNSRLGSGDRSTLNLCTCHILNKLTKVRHGLPVPGYFCGIARGKSFVFSGRFCKQRCSVDLPSCLGATAMTRLPQNVFAAEPSEQGR